MVELLKRYIKRFIPDSFLNLVLVILQIVIQTVLLMGEMKNIIDHGVSANNMDYVIHSGIMMLIYTALCAACIVVQSYISGRTVAGITRRIREDCFHKVSAMSEQDFARFGASTLHTRTISDPSQIELLLINFLRTSLRVPIIIICMLIMILRMNRLLFLVFLLFFAVTVFILFYIGAKSRPYFEELQKKIDHIALLVDEKISGMRPIRAFCNQRLEEEKLERSNQTAYETAIAANGRINFLAPLSLILMNWAVVFVYIIGSQQLKQHMVSISDLLLIFTYMGYFITCLAVIPFWVNFLPKAVVSARRIMELIEYEPGQAQTGKHEQKQSGITKGEVEFKNVIFGYNGAVNVIANVSFTAKGGKTTGIIGITGSGKTTVLNLLTGLYEMNFGDILVDGVSIRDYDADYLRSRISYGTQRAMVFQDTAYKNITAYGENCTEERVRAACDAAQFTEVIDKMPNGLETVMSQDGRNISGGQRQRLSLARTLAKEADIYLFDDTFSALDAKTEAAALKQTAQMLKGKTIIMVAQKISSIMNADNIIVLDRGSIVGQGKHEELLKNCREYQEIYKTQCYAEERGKENE